MDDPSDTADDASETTGEATAPAKAPAPVTGTSKRRASKASAKRTSPAKKTGATKAASVKKVAAKEAPAKKAAPVKEASANATSAAKKVAATSAAPPKKAPAAKPAPVKKAPAKNAAPLKKAPPVSVAGRSRQRASSANRRAVLCASITEEMLNELVPFALGDGISIDPMETSVLLPGMGKVDVRLGLKATSVVVDLRPENNGRVRITVHADGDVVTKGGSSDEVGLDGALGEPSGGIFAMPSMPAAPIPIIVEALVMPFFELGPDGAISIGLDFSDAELISVRTDTAIPAPEGVDTMTWPGILAMFSMVLGAIGQDLFASMREHVGTSKLQLDRAVGSMLLEVGAEPGISQVSVSSGLLTMSLPAGVSVKGCALPVPIAGKRVGIGVAESAVDSLTHELLTRLAGDMSLPFELDVSLGEQHVGSRLRNTRLLPESFPDLRSSLRTQIRTRLLRGQLEISVQSAWVEFPSMVPSLFNSLSKRVGGLVSLAPLKVKFPAIIRLPVPDTDDTIGIQADDLRVTSDGIGLVVSLV